MPVKLVGGGIDHVACRHFYGFTFVGLNQTRPGSDVKNLASGMTVPVGASTGLEMNPEGVEGVRIVAQRPEQRLSREVVGRGRCPFLIVGPTNFHDAPSLTSSRAYRCSQQSARRPGDGSDDSQVRRSVGMPVGLDVAVSMANRIVEIIEHMVLVG